MEAVTVEDRTDQMADEGGGGMREVIRSELGVGGGGSMRRQG